MRWFIIGAGNVAWHLSQILTEVGEVCVGTASRQGATVLPDLPAQASSEADIFLIAVADDAIAEVAKVLLPLPARMVVHTSGSVPLDALKDLAEKGWKTGIFYPLQTISKAKQIAWKQVPILIESEDLPTLEAIEAVGKFISDTVVRVDSQKRAWLHLAAVMTSNFLHHLCTIADEILQKQDLSLSLLQPLLTETLTKALAPLPAQTQTGPARRGDKRTIEKHLQLLADSTEYKAVYQALTNSILTKYNHL